MTQQEFLHQLDADRLARMVEVSRVLNSTTDGDTLLKLIITEAAALTGAEAASILLLDMQTRELRFKATADEMTPEMADTPVPLDNSIAGNVLTSNKPRIVHDVSKEPLWNPQVSQAINFPTGSILGVPMHDGAARPIGVLEALNKLNGRFTGEDVAILSIFADLAGVAVEKSRLIEKLKQANQQLNELDRLKSDFIALASHELRTPLSIILGYVSFLREEADSTMASQLDSVLKAAIRLRSLIQDMLNLQYVDAGKASLEQGFVDLAELVRGMVAERDETALAKQHTIRVNLPETSLPVLVDRGMIQVVISNLINNAVKFTPEGGRIDITIERRGSEAWLCVSDTGIGIAENQLDRIFHRFYQVEPHMRRHYEGMGLGLAIARELVELNQGRIWARSEYGLGSQFYVALPLQTRSQNGT
ncbi:MAG: GAF domain-containing sensor histidine kinase [Chloroflexi bacterium]|nr:GAF domain-containing sensor histidine kinase [Chloroflexota bacterium]MCI0575861.1 GAF domain-containing sensor histidine kinase [Chloroflexota bacterium]MCI0646588.1 GAF domain-containing sensor histidine kinase [Chloroflexota bacterium]MCI0726390.1 GAF domain-containing sensor histidine kinase [Chloroflexota bacterium]